MVPVIVGPTASGKSALAMLLAAELPGVEIVSADSRQVYRGLDIGTAKPTAAERALVPHHLIDIIDPSEVYSSGRYADTARGIIREILGRGGRPLVVGGSGFYVQALFEGLTAPAVSPEMYARITRRIEKEGYESILAELRAVDPEAAAAHSPNNRVKSVRALACYLETGVRYSEFSRRRGTQRFEIGARMLGIALPRALLYERINERVLEMVQSGLVEETRRVLDAGIPPDAPGLRTVGYVETIAYLRGELTREEMIADIQQSTRRYAKRQMTWFRRFSEITWITPAMDIREAVGWN